MKFKNFKIALFFLMVSFYVTGCTKLSVFFYNYSASSKESKSSLIVEALGINNHTIVADIGSGGGYFTFAFAKLAKRVYAVDIDLAMLDQIKQYAQENHIENIITIHSKENDPSLELHSVDLVFIRNVFHHLNNQEEYMKNLKKYLRPGARIAIIDYTGGRQDFVSWTGHFTPRNKIKNVMEDAGFVMIETYKFLSRQSFTVYKVNEISGLPQQ